MESTVVKIEKTKIERIQTDDPSFICQGMSFKVCSQTQRITGALMKCKDEIAYPSKKSLTSEVDIQSKIVDVPFKQGTYLWKIQTITQPDVNTIVEITFSFNDSSTHKLVQEHLVQARQRQMTDRIFDQISDKANCLNIFQMVFQKEKNSSYLIEFLAQQYLLPQFAPQALVSNFKSKGEVYISNYSEMKFLASIIPPERDVKDEVFLKLYQNVRAAIDEIISIKLELHDNLCDCANFMKRLENIFKQISHAVGPALEKRKFIPDHYPQEMKKLERLQTQIDENMQKLNQLEPRAQKLRDLRKVISALRSNIYSEPQIRNKMAMTQSTNTFSYLIEGQLQALKDQKSQKEKERKYLEGLLPNHTSQVKFIKDLIEEKNKALLDMNKSAQQFMVDQIQKKGEISKNPNSLFSIDHIQQEYEQKVAFLQNSFEQKQKQLDDQISAERLKMSSDSSMQSTAQSKPISYHFIMILDESSSMSGHWQSLSTTFDNFMQAFKDQGDSCKHFFSVILFENSARIHFKRLRANEIGNLGTIKGGGTIFSSGLQLASTLVSITPDDQSPIIMFMTDGSTSQSDLDKSQKILKELYSSPKGQKSMFFAIGFGTGYKLDALQELSQSANGGKKSVTMNQKEIEFVMEALDEKDLLTIFLGLSNTFEISAQESAVKALELQRKIDQNVLENQIDSLKVLNQKRIEALTSMNEQKTRIQKLAEQGTTKDLNKNIEQFKYELQNEIESLETQLEAAVHESSSKETDLDSLKVSINYLDKEIESANKSLEACSREKQLKSVIEDGQALIDKSKLDSFDGIKQFFSSLGSVDGTIDTLIWQLRQSKNLMTIYDDKVQDMMFQFEGGLAKKLQKGLSDQDLATKLIQNVNLPRELHSQTSRVVLQEALKKSDGKHFEKYEKFYNEIIEWIDFASVATCKKKNLAKYAKQYAKRIRPKQNKTKKKGKSSDSSGEDSSDSDDSDRKAKQGKKNGTKKDDLNAIQKDEDYIGDLHFVDEVEGKLKELKAKVKSLKKERGKMQDEGNLDEQKQKINRQKKKVTYCKVLLNDELLEETIEKCLRNIFDILSKVIGQDIEERAFNDFDQLFRFFVSQDKLQIQQFQEGVAYLSLESDQDIKHALQVIEQNKPKQAIKEDQEESKSQEVKAIMHQREKLQQIQYQ